MNISQYDIQKRANAWKGGSESEWNGDKRAQLGRTNSAEAD